MRVILFFNRVTRIYLYKKNVVMSFIKELIFPEYNQQKALSVLLLLARIVFGAMFLSHGVAKWMALENLSYSFPDPLGVGTTLSITLVLFAEVVCSVGVIFGALYRLCLIPMIITMCIAFFVIHSGDAFAAKELALLYLVLFVLMFFAGPGRYSIDAMIRRMII